MSSSTQRNAVTTWILGGIITLALLLMTLGGVMIVFDFGETEAISFENTRDGKGTYLETSPTPMHVSGAIMLDTPTPVDWSAFMPTPENINAYQAVEVFGSVAMGSDKPVVTIIEYGAYGCTSCRKVYQDHTLQDLMEAHGDQVRYVFVAWPVQHTNDPLATEAVLCAKDQGKEVFWAYHDALLEMSQAEFNAYENVSRFASLAEHVSMDVEMDVEAFEICLIEGTHREFVYNLTDMGFRIGLRGTPTFYINGHMTSSMYVTKMVDELLAEEN